MVAITALCDETIETWNEGYGEIRCGYCPESAVGTIHRIPTCDTHSGAEYWIGDTFVGITDHKTRGKGVEHG